MQQQKLIDLFTDQGTNRNLNRNLQAYTTESSSTGFTHLEAELVVVLIESNVHQTATKTVVWKNEENVLQNLVNVSQILNNTPISSGYTNIKYYVT